MRYLFVCSVLGLLIFGCSHKKRVEKVHIKIVQTTDVHGTIFPYNFIDSTDNNPSLAQVYTLVKKWRSTPETQLILLDNGDYLQGHPAVYYYNFEDTTSEHLGGLVMRYMQYDAASVGNHDIETGHPVYDRFRKQIGIPYLAANAIDKHTGKPYFEPYTIIEREGVRVAVLGLITPGIAKWLPEKLWQGIEFTDMIDAAKEWMPIIQEKEKPDMVIGLFHSGIDFTFGGSDSTVRMNENASRLVAEQVRGFDVVIAGHDHKKHLENVINRWGDTVVLIDARSYAKAIGLLTVDFTWNPSIQKYNRTILAEILAVDTVIPDSEFLEKFAPHYATVKNFVGRQIGAFDIEMDSKYAYIGNSLFMDFIHNVQLRASGAQISFASPLTFHTKIKKGPIFVSDLFKLYTYENQLYTISLSGNEIDGYLEYSVEQWFNTMRNVNDNLLNIAVDNAGRWRFKNPYFNFSSAEGIDYLVDVTKPTGHKVKILGLSSGQPFFADSMYTVALNSYRANGGGGHLTDGAKIAADKLKERVIKVSDDDIRFLIMKYIEQQNVVSPIETKNWRIIPEDYYEWGSRKDLELVIGGRD